MKWKLKNPVIPIQVKQFNGDNLDDVCDFMIQHDWDICERDYKGGRIIVEDDSGRIHRLSVGDYAVHYEQFDNFAVFKKEKFESIYEPVR